MGKRRFIYRRTARKTNPRTTVANGKQTAYPFFDYGGGEHSFFSGKAPQGNVVNPKCDNCENEEKQVQKKENSSGGKASENASSKIKSIQGGNGLPGHTRNFFEPKFGSDFSNVKIHNDSSAHEIASSVHARAFTYKNNIVFNRGEYDTESDKGRKLLAHELTHVIQQAGAVSRMEKEKKDEEHIQRKPKDSDFNIKGLDPSSAADDSIIRFDLGQTLVPSVEVPKIKKNATPAVRQLTLTGFSSEEGTAKENKSVVNSRLLNVSSQLSKEGHDTSKVTKVSNTTAGEGIKDYRKMRSVEIVPTPVGGGPVPTSVPSGAVTTVSCGGDIPAAFGTAVGTTINAIVKLYTLSPADKKIFADFFGGNKVSDVINNLWKILNEIVRHSTVFNTATDCHSGASDMSCSSGAGAYCDTNVSPAKMVFCESFVSYSTPLKAEYIVHEASHGTPGLMTKDKGYENERIIRTLPDADKLKNADNYLLLVRVLNNPKAVGYTSPTDTIAGGATKAETDFANKALAFLEQWVWKANYYSGSLYGEIHDGLSNPAKWTGANPGDYFIVTMQSFAKLFGLTDPGTTSPFKAPVRNDKIRVAGIFDRYSKMSQAMGANITLEKSTAGKDAWAKEGGPKAEVPQGFFTKSDLDAVKHLMAILVRSFNSVPSGLVDAYVQAADGTRKQEGVGP